MSYRVNQYHHKKTTEQRAVEGLLKGLWWIISTPFKLIFGQFGKEKRSQRMQIKETADKEFVENKLREIDQLMQMGGSANYQKAVLESDKLLDHILKSFRVPGMTMADRLKSSKKRFSDEGYNAAWRGHIVRNELVHNAEFELMSYNAEETIKNYQKAINELTNV